MEIVSKKILEKVRENADTPFVSKECFQHNILSWKDVENYLNNNYSFTKDQLNIIDGCGNNFNPTMGDYSWSPIKRYIPEEVFSLINSGNTFALFNMSRFNKECNSLANDIESGLDEITLDFHVFGGLKSICQSFSIHKDFSYNLIFQIDGKSRWMVYNTDSNLPRNLESDDQLNLLIDEILDPGDVVYIPVNYYHKCIPLGKRLSISVCFRPTFDGEFNKNREWFTLGI